jgi:hypothetical protein
MAFTFDVKNRVGPKRDYLYFADVANVIEEVAEHFGEFQDKECLVMKDKLVAKEQPEAPGRLRLADFYHLAEDGLFAESKNYLRELGALDESDINNPRVIITNYLHGPSNCIASSNYYSVCCRDECEHLLSHLERALQKPFALPAELSAMISALPSRTVKANRALSPWLSARLEEIAALHGGHIPLHGRLFAQWMHYAYPRECAYPHVAGAIKPPRLEESFAASFGENSIDDMVASPEEMQEHIESASNYTVAEDSELTMWVSEEELLVTRSEMVFGTEHPSSAGFRGLTFAGVLLSASFGVMRVMVDGRLRKHFDLSEKYMV